MATRKRTTVDDPSIRAATIVRIAAYDAGGADTIVQPDGLRVPASHPRTGERLTREERAILAELTETVAQITERYMVRAYRAEIAGAQDRATERLEALPAEARSA